jgi:ribosome-associated protein
MKKKTAANKPSLLDVILHALSDLKAQNVITIDVSRLSDVMDTLVIASGSSNRQVRALAQHAAEETKKKGMPAMSSEGLDDGEWALVDFGDVVLHVMQPEVREFYDLEKLWLVPGHSEVIATAKEKTTGTAKTSTAKSSVAKTSTKKTTTTKPASTKAASKKLQKYDETFVNQSDAAKARKKPATKKPLTKKTVGATAPVKAGVYAKTGTRKPAAKNTAVAKTTGTKQVATKKPATKKTAVTKPSAARATTKSAPKKPRSK